MSRLDDRVAVVTGAGSGIGRAAAVRFTGEGATVVCVDLDEGGLAETVRQCDGASARAHRADVTSEHDMRELTASTVRDLGRIDVVYANAGIAGTGTAGEVSRDTWDRVIAVHLTGTWLSVRYALSHMVDQGGGSIITQGSVGGLLGVPRIAAYAAAKGGIIALTRQIAVDYGPHGVRANVICPGTVWTPLVEQTYAAGGGMPSGASAEERRQAAGRRYPLRRLGTPEDVAAMAAFLASDDGRWVTGAVHTVDGGLTAG